MSNWRDIKSRAKQAVHGTFKIPAVYLTHAAGAPVSCNVRHHDKVDIEKNEFTWPKTSGHYALEPGITFDESEVPKPLGRSYVFLSYTEAYQIGTVEPFRSGFARAEVTPVGPDALAALVASLPSATQTMVYALTGDVPPDGTGGGVVIISV